MNNYLSFEALKDALYGNGASSLFFMDIRNIVLNEPLPNNPAMSRLHMRMGAMARRFLSEMMNLRKDYSLMFHDDGLHRSAQKFTLEASGLDIEDVFLSLGTQFQEIHGSDYQYVQKMHMVNIQPVRGLFFDRPVRFEITTADQSTHIEEADVGTLLILRDGVMDVRHLNNPSEFKSTRYTVFTDDNTPRIGGCIQVSYHPFSTQNVMGDLIPCGLSAAGELVPVTGPNPRTFSCPAISQLQDILRQIEEHAA